jgi:carbamoyltransferase
LKDILVGLHFSKHDANISIYDGKKFLYFLLERQDNAPKKVGIEIPFNKSVYKDPTNFYLSTLKNIFNKYSLDIRNIASIAVGDSNWYYSASNEKYEKIKWFSDICDDVYFVDHHYAHHLSNFNTKDSWICDGHGNDMRYSTVFKNDMLQETLKSPDDGESIGLSLEKLAAEFIGDASSAGHVMALTSLGMLDKKYYEQHKNDSISNSLIYSDKHRFFLNWVKNMSKFREPELFNYDYVKTLHEITKQIYYKYLKNFFHKDDKFLFSGGVSQSIVLNTFFKKMFSNLEITPHGYDGGISLGLLYFLINKYNYDLPNLDKFPFLQADEHPGLPSKNTIKKTAEYLSQGKIVLWYQENGELGPRALGNRSILANPLIPDMKEQVNNKVKKRAWYRPYGASVLEEDYQKYFDLEWKSPFMLYQANVKHPKELKAITHFDKTCRIQTVESKHSIFHELIENFKKITGVPILLNTSFNLPGKPIVGTKNNAKITFEKSQADVLVMGDDIYCK